jgi:subtilisin-like proprotein convertase family protein
MKKFFQYIIPAITLVFVAATISACGDDKNETGKDKSQIDGDANGDNRLSEVADFNAKVIYGDDDRLDVFQLQDQRLLAAADSTVALILNTDLKQNGDTVDIATLNYGTSFNPPLCTEERFHKQETAAFCSGFLVGPNLVATAGHCIRTQGTQYSDCESTSFVFGFALKKSTDVPRNVAASEVYRCKGIVKTVMTSTGADFAIVELDRPVVGHKPLTIRRSGSAAVNDSLVVIGHPSGLPTKIASNGFIRKIVKTHYVASLDTFGGNSGSAVFNAKTMDVEGILVRGEEDFVKSGSCQVSKRCAQAGCRGEDVTNILEAAPFIPVIDDPNPVPDPDDTVSFVSEKKLDIPDNATAGVNSSVIATSAPSGKKVYIQVDITHPWRGDLVVSITAPDGTVVILSDRQGRSADNLFGVFGNDLVSKQDMNALSKVTRAGEWKLNVSDRSGRDVGTLNRWGVYF